MHNHHNRLVVIILLIAGVSVMNLPASALAQQWMPTQAKIVMDSTDFSFTVGKEVVTCEATVGEGKVGKESSIWTSTPEFSGCSTSQVKAGSPWTATAVKDSEATLEIPKGEKAGITIEISANCKVRIEAGVTLGAVNDFENGESGILKPSTLLISEQKVPIAGTSKECGESATTATISANIVLLNYTSESKAIDIGPGGPWWRHLSETEEQLKYPENEEKPLKAKNEGLSNFKLISNTPLFGKVLIECKKVAQTGNLWDGVQQGEDNATLKFEECEATTALGGKCPKVTISNQEVYSELMWKYAGIASELKEIGQQKIYDAVASTEVPSGGKATLATVTLPEGCTGSGKFLIQATGTEAKFVDQKGESHNIIWGTAAFVEPQNEDAAKGFLRWTIPNVTETHHQETPIKAKLTFAEKPAEIEGTIAVELNSAEKFGAFNE